MNHDSPELLELPFDQYQRYRLLAEVTEILRPGQQTLRILEVGGYPPRLSGFLPQDEVVVSDQPAGDFPAYLQADGTRLPFRDGAFHLVASLDTLEHIPREKRGVFLEELCRTAKDYLVVAAPFQCRAAREAERIIFEFIRVHAGYEHAFFKEHLEQEAPDQLEVEKQFLVAGFHTLVLANGRLDHWLMLMAIYYFLDGRPEYDSLKRRVMAFWNKNYYRADNQEPAYRHFLIGSRQPFGPREAELSALMNPEPGPAPDWESAKAMLELARLDREKNLQSQIAELQDRLVHREREVEGLKAELEKRGRFLQRLSSFFFSGRG